MRHDRYAAIVSPEALSITCLIVGVGAIGSWIATLLAHMGVARLHIVDPDTVSDANLGPQCYWPADLDSFKVDALSHRLSQINPDLLIHTQATTFDPSHLNDSIDYVFSCADSMACRRQVLDAFRDSNARALIETRMGAETLHILTTDLTPTSLSTYEASLFDDALSLRAPCGAETTPYNPALCASLAVHRLSLFLRKTPPRPHIGLDLPTSTLFSVNPASLAAV